MDSSPPTSSTSALIGALGWAAAAIVLVAFLALSLNFRWSGPGVEGTRRAVRRPVIPLPLSSLASFAMLLVLARLAPARLVSRARMQRRADHTAASAAPPSMRRLAPLM